MYIVVASGKANKTHPHQFYTDYAGNLFIASYLENYKARALRLQIEESFSINAVRLT